MKAIIARFGQSSADRFINLFAAACVAAGLVLAGVTPARAAITIGQGPVIGADSNGNTYYEEFQDWAYTDLRALDGVGSADPNNGQYFVNDGRDRGRDLMAFYSRNEGANYYFRVDLYDLQIGDENGFLDIYVAIDTGSTTAPTAQFLPDNLDVQVDPARHWELCVRLYDSVNRNLVLGDYVTNRPPGEFLGVYYNATLDSVEFGIAKTALYAAGWNGVSPLHFTVATAKDFYEINSGGCSGGYYSDVLDTFYDLDRGLNDCVINGAIASNGPSPGRAEYATIAHANQSINKAADIRVHIYDPSVPQTEKTGFIRALDTHQIFKVPLNMHISGSLLTAAMWAVAPTGGADKSDGPSWIQRCKQLADASVTSNPSSFIGGVYAEHIMPYFEGPTNRISMDLFEEVARAILGQGAAEMKVMHVPERVIRSKATGFSPLNGFTFADIAATTYTATYLDEVTHYHWWFDAGNTSWSGFGGSHDAPNQHKIQKINGIYVFLINDREDRAKFGNDDGGLALDTRYTLLNKAMQADQAQITVVFDDWEAIAGKSFNIEFGNPVPNNNMIQYQNTIRWLANKQWVEIVNLKDILDRATNPSNPQYNPAWVVDRGTQTNLGMQTYEYLKWSSEGTYDYWYYNQDGVFTGNEQDFYNLVPVLRGPQGDYYARGLQATIQAEPLSNRSNRANQLDTAAGSVFLPSGRKLGDLNTSNTLLHNAWVEIANAPDNALRRLGMFKFNSMIYETAWHEEQYPIGYDNTNYQQTWSDPDDTWDGVNTWCLRLNNHARGTGFLAYAAQWARDVQQGLQTAATSATSLDLDQDGQVEYVLRNNKVLALFDRHGGRMLYAFHYHPTAGPISVIGAPVANPSAPGEEEYTGTAANRCSGLKDMNGGTYADAVYTVQVGVPNGRSLRLTSPDSLIQKTIELPDNKARLEVSYTETVSGPLYTRIGASPNHLNLIKTGRTNLTTGIAGDAYYVQNAAGGAVYVTTPPGVTRNPAPADAGFQNRNLALTEEIEVYGNGTYGFWIGFDPTDVPAGVTEFNLY
ncbi:MAG: hypothetical protein N2111_03760 [Candidatus Sumerlaeaceae bacterium]|nr:hypothetical protein [Candidatus Sumerlaeaceae bacterium]